MSDPYYFVYWTQLHATMPQPPDNPNDGIRAVVFASDYEIAVERANREEATAKYLLLRVQELERRANANAGLVREAAAVLDRP